MGKVIAVANQKGGVGKTTTTVNLGIGLAKHNKKVLCIDADSQGSLTISLGIAEPDCLNYTFSNIISDICNKKEVNSEVFHKHEENISFIPSNVELANTEIQLVNRMGRELVLKRYINQIKSNYDYIIIDCSPNLGMITVNALTCADTVLVPVQAAYLPIKGLQLLFDIISQVQEQFNPSLKIEGILITMFDNRTKYSKEIVQLLNNEYGGVIKIFKSIIPRSVKQDEATVSGNSIYKYAKNSKVAKSYEEFVLEILEEV